MDNNFFTLMGKIFTTIIAVKLIHFMIIMGIGVFQFYSLPKEIRQIKAQNLHTLVKHFQQVQLPIVGAPMFKNNDKN